MKEKEFMEFLNTLAIDVTEHYDKKVRNDMFVRYYITGGFHFVVILQYNFVRNEYTLELSGMTNFKISRTHVIESEHISSLFVELPKCICGVIRELNSCD